MKKTSGIYKIESKSHPDRCYIGSSTYIKDRWDGHLRCLRKNNHHSQKLQHHYNKYGEDDLVFSVIKPCLPAFSTIREQYYIDKIKPWFNVCPKAGSAAGKKHTDEAKQKNRDAHLGLKHTDEHNQKIAEAQDGENNSFYGKHHSEETKRKMSESNRNRPPQSHESRRKQAESLRRTMARKKEERLKAKP